MIDPRILRDEPDRVRASQRKRGASESLVDDALAADQARRASIATFEELRAEQKALGKQVAQAKGPDAAEVKAELLARTKAVAAQVKEAEAAQREAEDAWTTALKQIRNIAADETPAGGEDDFVVLETVGTP
ncbi:MAG: serine--tRNA ligase, partial [Nocardioides sp.]